MSIVKYAKRSVSIPADLAAALDQQAVDEGTTVSALLARAAAREVYVRRGLDAVKSWQHDTGIAFGEEEIASVDALLDAAGVGTTDPTNVTVAARRAGAHGKAAKTVKPATSATRAAATSSKALRDGRVSASVAVASALSQRAPTPKKSRARSK